MRIIAATGLFFCFLVGTVHADVYRCGNSYSSEPCEGGKIVDVSPAMSDFGGAGTKEIYLCRNKVGRLYWIRERCSERGWLIDRIARVPKDASWDDQVEIARRQQRNAASLASTPRASGSANSETPSNGIACQQLDERIKWLDDMARVDSRPWITEERRLARDKQFRLRC